MKEKNIITQYQKLLSEVEVGEPQHHAELTIFPLLGQNGHQPSYTLLEEAIRTGKVTVQEESESGNVPTLLVDNQLDTPVLILEGEILIGAKQNRMVNESLMLAAQEKTLLPVSCVESGRWAYRSRHFHSEHHAHSKLRAEKMRMVHRNKRESGEARSDQGKVWEEVRMHLHARHVESPTESLSESYRAAEERLEEFRKGFRMPEDAHGFLVCRANQVVGMDLFDSPRTLRAQWKRLSDSYFLEEIGRPLEKGKASIAMARTFLKHLKIAVRVSPKSVGIGEHLEVEDRELVGAALFYDERICHLSAFTIQS